MTDNVRVENAVTLSRTFLRDDNSNLDGTHKTKQHKWKAALKHPKLNPAQEASRKNRKRKAPK